MREIDPSHKALATIRRGATFGRISHGFLALGLSLNLLAAAPWWRDYHTVLSHPQTKITNAWEMGMMAERSAWATAWYGNWWIQQQAERRGRYDSLRYAELLRAQGLKNVFYFDAGEYGEFVALTNQGKLLLSQWELPFYRGEPGQLMWFGDDGFYHDDHLLGLKNYQDYGLPAWKMPDGTRPASVFDFSILSLEGKHQPWVYSSVNVPPQVAEKLGLPEFLRTSADPPPPSTGRGSSVGRIRTFDHSNPFLFEDFKVGVGMLLEQQPGFLHFDNYFDNETLYPSHAAFGPWSLEKFKRFLQTRLTDAECKELGIEEPARFGLRQYLEMHAPEAKPPQARWKKSQWENDRVWNAFLVSKYCDADELFRKLYAFCKERSRALGHEVVVAGNTIPLFPGGSLCSGGIDLVHFEYHVDRQYGPIVIPPGLPPRGKMGGAVRLAAALGTTGYCWPTIYVPKELSGPGHENLHKVLAFDCLANRGVLDYNFQYLEGFSPGSDQSAGWINCFIKNFSAYFGSRAPQAEVGLVFPGHSMLAGISVFSMNPEFCLYDYLGWAQAMTDLRYLWDAVPDDQLANADLSRFQVLVLPSTQCLPDTALKALTAYAQRGGKVIVSGQAGARFGVEKFLWPRAAQDPVLAQWQQASGQIPAPECPGKAYYTDRTGEPGKRNGAEQIRQRLGQAVRNRRVAVDAPTTVGAALYAEADGGVAVDLVNYNVDAPTDRLTPAAETRVTIWPPKGQGSKPAQAQLISPQWRTRAQFAAATRPAVPWVYETKTLPVSVRPDGGIEVVVPPFEVYVVVRVK